MKNIFKALNVTSEMELNKLVESLDLEINDYINFMSMLNETLEPQTIRDNLLQLTESLYNGSYEKLKEQISKKPFVRKLKEETVYDHSWYEVKKQKYPKRTKYGVKGLPIKESKNENNDEIERIHNEYLENKLNAFQAIEDLYIYTNFSTKEINEILYKWLEEKEKIKSDKEEKELNENFSNESEYKVGQKLMYKKNGTTYVIDKVNGKYYDIKDSYSNKVYPVYKDTLDSEFKLLKESFEDEEVENDTTEVKEPKQKSSADPEITQFIATTEKVVNNTTNPDILQGILDSIDVKIALAVDVEQSNKLGELKQKTETKLMSAHKIDQISESFDYDNYVPNFHIGDNVEFYWGDEKYTGRVVEVKDRGTYELYNIISYNPKTEREETFINVEADDNLMTKISDDYEFEEYDDDYEFEEYDDLDETCAAGATCAANVSGFAKPIGTTIKRNKKKVKETFDSKLFKESILNDMECSSKINGKQLRYFFNEGRYYLSVDNALVKSFDKDVMIETVDEIMYDEDISYKLLEGYSCYEMNILMEDVTANPLNPNGIEQVDDEEINEPKTPEEIQFDDEIKQDIGSTNNEYAIQSPDNENELIKGQHPIGFDEDDDLAIVKGDDGKINIVDSRKLTKISESVLTEGIADVAKYFPKLDIESIKNAVRMDPTYTGGDRLGKYGKWILRLISNNVKNIENEENYRKLLKQYPDGINPKNGQPFKAPIRLPEVTNEDRYKITQSLKKYDIYKEEIGKAIDAFKTLPELDAAISEVEERGVPAHKLARQRLGIFKEAMKKGLKRVYEDGKWIVGIPKTHESSKMFGNETSWCTTSNGSYYNDYSSQGPLFINLNKDNGRLYQFHFQTASFMDEHDSTRRWEDGGNIDGFFSENPFLEHFYKDYVRYEDDPKKIVKSLLNNRNKLNDIFEDVYNLTFDGNNITGRLDIEDIRPIYRDRDTVSLSFISKMLSGDWWEAFNGGDYDVGYVDLEYNGSEFDSEIKKISQEGGIDLTKIKWSEIIYILRTDGTEETENFTEEEAEKLYDKMTNDFNGDKMSIWNVFSDCKTNGSAEVAYNSIRSDLIDNLPLNSEKPFINRDLNIYIPFDDLVGMCTDNSTVRVDIESDPTWYDRLYNDLDFSNGWLYSWYSSKNSTDDFGIYEPRYGWDGFDDSQWRYAISNFVHYIHTLKRGNNNEIK